MKGHCSIPQDSPRAPDTMFRFSPSIVSYQSAQSSGFIFSRRRCESSFTVMNTFCQLGVRVCRLAILHEKRPLNRFLRKTRAMICRMCYKYEEVLCSTDVAAHAFPMR
jgi:hypothetical protein